MPLTLAELRARHHRAGQVDWIGLRPARGEPMTIADGCKVSFGGLLGDRGRKGPRAVTLIQAEHLAVIAELTGRNPLNPNILRRNIVVSGINLNALKDIEVAVGSARIKLTVPCHPCSLMEAALGPGGYNAMRGHGGWCAEVVAEGEVLLGSVVAPV